MTKSTREVSKMMKKNGFELIRSKKHLVFAHKGTGARIATSATASDWRTMKNLQTTINRVVAHQQMRLAA